MANFERVTDFPEPIKIKTIEETTPLHGGGVCNFCQGDYYFTPFTGEVRQALVEKAQQVKEGKY